MKTVSKIYFQCDKCGEEIEYEPYGEQNWKKDACWSINLGRAGYDSRLDGCDVNFDICDNCLTNFINTFKYRDRVHNSGSNTYFEPEDYNE